MRIVIVILVLALTSCATKKTLSGYHFSKIGSNEDFLYGNVPHDPTQEEQEYFESAMDALVKAYDLKVKDYVFQYSFSKNTFGDTEVWVLAYRDNPYTPPDSEEIYRTTPSNGNYYALVNVTRERAYFYEDFSNQDPFGQAASKGYFYLKGKTKEVKNFFGHIIEPTVWRDFNFEDWKRLSDDESEE